jgi:hypothetical protein
LAQAMPRYYFDLSDGDLSLADDEVGESRENSSAHPSFGPVVARVVAQDGPHLCALEHHPTDIARANLLT